MDLIGCCIDSLARHTSYTMGQRMHEQGEGWRGRCAWPGLCAGRRLIMLSRILSPLVCGDGNPIRMQFAKE